MGWTELRSGATDWIGLPVAETNALLLMADAKTKTATRTSQERAIFKLYSLGVSTNRDDWLYDRRPNLLLRKLEQLSAVYDRLSPLTNTFPDTIKWSRNLKRRLAQGRREKVSSDGIVEAEYRPFTTRMLYRSSLYVDELGSALFVFPKDEENVAIGIARGRRGAFACLATARTPALDWFIPDAYQYQPRYRYTKSGERIDNITDWALNKFVAHYGKKGVTKDAIFHYVYAVLHDPIYRETYALNLKREFPRIPFYPDFSAWAAWGEALMAMHIGYEQVEPWPIERNDTPNPRRAEGTNPKPILKSVPDQGPETGSVRVDEDTQITGIPAAAWTYRLGNRSAIDWVLDQHKEKTPRDLTIREKFNTYRFADYKESMIALLAKVVRVSMDTVAITDAMAALDRTGWQDEAGG